MSYFYNTPLESLTGIVINFERTSTSWQPGKFLKTKVRTHDENAGCIEEITGVCTAIQVNTSVRGEEALMKVKLQYVVVSFTGGEAKASKMNILDWNRGIIPAF